MPSDFELIHQLDDTAHISQRANRNAATGWDQIGRLSLCVQKLA